jgi:hypothetical protein
MQSKQRDCSIRDNFNGDMVLQRVVTCHRYAAVSYAQVGCLLALYSSCLFRLGVLKQRMVELIFIAAESQGFLFPADGSS